MKEFCGKIIELDFVHTAEPTVPYYANLDAVSIQASNY